VKTRRWRRRLGAWSVGLGLLAVASAAEAQGILSHSVVAVATTSTSVLAEGLHSLQILVNDSDTTIYCNLAGGAAVVGEGVRLNAAGGNLFLDGVHTTTVACIHGGTGTKNVLTTRER
jgi:hypothetical protein